MQERHQQMTEAVGNQPEQVIAAARERAQRIEQDAPGVSAQFCTEFRHQGQYLSKRENVHVRIGDRLPGLVKKDRSAILAHKRRTGI